MTFSWGGDLHQFKLFLGRAPGSELDAEGSVRRGEHPVQHPDRFVFVAQPVFPDDLQSDETKGQIKKYKKTKDLSLLRSGDFCSESDHATSQNENFCPFWSRGFHQNPN